MNNLASIDKTSLIHSVRGLAVFSFVVIISACGGGGGGGGGEGGIATNDPLEPPPVQCVTALVSAEEYECRVAPTSSETRFSLTDAPEGMVIQPVSGYLHWTPVSHQVGTHSFTVKRTTGSDVQNEVLEFEVSQGVADAVGLFVSPTGSDSATGTADNPFATLHHAASVAQPGQTIYLRGGEYRNEGFGEPFEGRRNNLARITTSGTEASPITISAHGNEYATLRSDVNGIVFNGASYWRVQNLELYGGVETLSREISLSLWWVDDGGENRIQGRGIALNGAFHIDIENNRIHGFSGAGVSNNNGAHITLLRNLIYDNAWWSTSGTHGFANSKPLTTDNADTTSFKIQMRENLVFGNQSSMISHVFSKGVVKLEIDEGNGLHMQNNGGDFVGRFLVEQNLVLFNGKAGLGLNTVDGGVIRRNGFFENAQAVASNGELSIQSSTSDSIVDNVFKARSDRPSIKDFQGAFAGVGRNYAVATVEDTDLPAEVVQVQQVFVDSQGGDYRAAASLPDDVGPSDEVIAFIVDRIAEFGLTLRAAPTLVTRDYVEGLRAEIIPSWPAPDATDTIPEDLILEDPDTGFCYAYADRNDYPGPPSTGTTCP